MSKTFILKNSRGDWAFCKQKSLFIKSMRSVTRFSNKNCFFYPCTKILKNDLQNYNVIEKNIVDK